MFLKTAVAPCIGSMAKNAQEKEVTLPEVLKERLTSFLIDHNGEPLASPFGDLVIQHMRRVAPWRTVYANFMSVHRSTKKGAIQIFRLALEMTSYAGFGMFVSDVQVLLDGAGLEGLLRETIALKPRDGAKLSELGWEAGGAVINSTYAIALTSIVAYSIIQGVPLPQPLAQFLMATPVHYSRLNDNQSRVLQSMVDSAVHRHANRTVQCPALLALVACGLWGETQRVGFPKLMLTPDTIGSLDKILMTYETFRQDLPTASSKDSPATTSTVGDLATWILQQLSEVKRAKELQGEAARSSADAHPSKLLGDASGVIYVLEQLPSGHLVLDLAPDPSWIPDPGPAETPPSASRIPAPPTPAHPRPERAGRRTTHAPSCHPECAPRTFSAQAQPAVCWSKAPREPTNVVMRWRRLFGGVALWSVVCVWLAEGCANLVPSTAQREEATLQLLVLRRAGKDSAGMLMRGRQVTRLSDLSDADCGPTSSGDYYRHDSQMPVLWGAGTDEAGMQLQ